MVRENLCENRLFSYHKADNAALSASVEFPPTFDTRSVKTDHVYSERAMKEVKTAELHTEWHDVPAGTRVLVLRVGKDWQGNTIAAVQRLDGELMPLPNGGYGKTGAVSYNYLLFDAQVDRNPEGHDPAEGHGRNDESPVAAASGDAPKGVGHG